MLIIHLSDLHFTGRAGCEHFSAAMKIAQHINSHHPGAHVLITGDVTDDGSPEQYADALAFVIRGLPDCKVFLVPGNHDYAKAGNFFDSRALARWNNILSEPFIPGVLLGSWMSVPYPANDGTSVTGIGAYIDLSEIPISLIGLDTADPQDQEFFARGVFDSRHCQALDKLLVSLSGTIRIVFFHHHPFIRPEAGIYDAAMALDGADKLMAVLKNSEFVFFGHKHVAGVWNSNTRQMFAAPAAFEKHDGKLRYLALSLDYIDGKLHYKAGWITC